MSSSLVVALLCLHPAASPQQVAEAKTYFEAGQQAYGAAQYLDAARAFERAFQIVPNPAIRFSLGQSYRLYFFQSGDAEYLKRALIAYKAYLREAPQQGRQKDAIELIANLERQRVSLRLPPVEAGSAIGSSPPSRQQTKTKIMVASTTPGAVARIDGEPPESVPVIKEMPPGEHKVRVEAPGYFAEDAVAIAVEGQFIVSQVNLQPKPAVLQIEAPENSTVQIDGLTVGVAPLRSTLEVKAGRHQVVVTRAGKHPFVEEVDLGLGEQTQIDANLKTTNQRVAAHWFLGAAAVAFVVTGAAVVVAIFSEGEARLINQQLNEDMENITNDQLIKYNDARSRRNNLLTASTVGVVASALFGGVGAALFFFDDPRAGIPAPSAPQGAGLGVRGSF